jgi:hypothetical protein
MKKLRLGKPIVLYADILMSLMIFEWLFTKRRGDMRKRTWHYVMKPQSYSMTCDKCDGSNIEWSEYEHKIWCYDCKIDTDGNDGIFGGPIALGVAALLGISFNRFNLKTNRVEYPRLVGRRIKYFAKPKVE